MKVTVQYNPNLRSCPYCSASLDANWKEHFILSYMDIGFENAQVLFASLVCKPLADKIKQEAEGEYVPSSEIASINCLVPVQAQYRETERDYPFKAFDKPKDRLN